MAEFGTSGLRGLATDLTDDLCATYAAAFVALHAPGGRLFIGQDMRDSSPRIAAAVTAGAKAEGAEAVPEADVGVVDVLTVGGAEAAVGGGRGVGEEKLIGTPASRRGHLAVELA